MRGLSGSLLALTLTLTVAQAQTAQPAASPASPAAPAAQAGAPAAPAAARRPTPPAAPTPPAPAALQGPETFTCGAAKNGEISLVPAALVFDAAAGFDLKTAPAIANGICSSDKPYFFSISVPEGNYRITLALGGKAASVVTVRAEARRLMLEKIPIKANATLTKSFDVNVRVPEFKNPDGTPSRVRLKDREIGNLNWDQKLTLEFNGTNPSFHDITITPLVGSKAEPVVYLAGDSTMVDQDVEPWASWGQQLPRFFLPGVVVANHAESGEASNSFVSELRFAKVMSLIKPGDYFFVQFAHNDQKQGPDFPARYRTIMTDFVSQVRAKGATPVIVTAMNREDFDADGKIRDSIEPYPQISREVAAATNTALIDLNAMSKTMFDIMGKEGADHAFMKFKAGSYPGVERDISDTTHFNNYGAYELARCIVQGIRDNKLPLANFLDPAIPAFDPAKFDPFPTFSLPYTPPPRKEDVTRIPQT